MLTKVDQLRVKPRSENATAWEITYMSKSVSFCLGQNERLKQREVGYMVQWGTSKELINRAQHNMLRCEWCQHKYCF